MLLMLIWVWKWKQVGRDVMVNVLMGDWVDQTVRGSGDKNVCQNLGVGRGTGRPQDAPNLPWAGGPLIWGSGIHNFSSDKGSSSGGIGKGAGSSSAGGGATGSGGSCASDDAAAVGISGGGGCGGMRGSGTSGGGGSAASSNRLIRIMLCLFLCLSFF